MSTAKSFAAGSQSDTPFHVWLNSAVNEMQEALGTEDLAIRRVHLFRCFNALMKCGEEVVRAYVPIDMVR